MYLVLERLYMNRLRYILQHRWYIKIGIGILILGIFLNTIFFKSKSIYVGSEIEFEGVVYKIKNSNNKRMIYFKGKEKLIINDYDMKEEIFLGDKIKVIGNLERPSNNTIPKQFNYQKYLYYEGIYYLVKAKEITVIKKNTRILFYIRERMRERVENIRYGKEYIQIFLLGDNSLLEENIIESFRSNGISHLFSISGMHISLFASLLLFIFKRISYNNFYNYGMVILFLLFYTLLVGGMASVVRSLVMYILFVINKLGNFKMRKIDIMIIVLGIMLLINPYYLYNMSFQYSYLISFSLIIFNYKIKYIKNYFLKNLYISIISFLVSFPICIYNFYQVNILSIILNVLLIPLVSMIIFPLSLISFVFPITSVILNIFILIFEKISLLVTESGIGILEFAKPSYILIFVYYILIYLFLYNYKYIYVFLLMIIHKNYLYFCGDTRITYLDVGQGDSVLIQMPYNKENILIDTGGLVNSDYSIVLNKTILYFKSIGLESVDSLILTHGDYDHMGEAINLVENFKVEKVIFNCGEYNGLEKELIKVLNKRKISYHSCIKELNIENNKLFFLNNKDYGNENDNSSVIYTEINGYKFMFMGDAGIDKEKDILDKYNISNIDVLKVGHHGSKTSSGN